MKRKTSRKLAPEAPLPDPLEINSSLEIVHPQKKVAVLKENLVDSLDSERYLRLADEALKPNRSEELEYPKRAA